MKTGHITLHKGSVIQGQSYKALILKLTVDLVKIGILSLCGDIIHREWVSYGYIQDGFHVVGDV